jgi:hypothetical protein
MLCSICIEFCKLRFDNQIPQGLFVSGAATAGSSAREAVCQSAWNYTEQSIPLEHNWCLITVCMSHWGILWLGLLWIVSAPKRNICLQRICHSFEMCWFRAFGLLTATVRRRFRIHRIQSSCPNQQKEHKNNFTAVHKQLLSDTTEASF